MICAGVFGSFLISESVWGCFSVEVSRSVTVAPDFTE